jgi:hypothetical protein
VQKSENPTDYLDRRMWKKRTVHTLLYPGRRKGSVILYYPKLLTGCSVFIEKLMIRLLEEEESESSVSGSASRVK